MSAKRVIRKPSFQRDSGHFLVKSQESNRTTRHFISYFDILEYDEIALTHTNLLEVIEDIVVGPLRNQPIFNLNAKFYCFNDSVVMCFKYDPSFDEFLPFESFIIAMQAIQTQLSIMGIYISGSITVGDVYTGKNFIYGQGIIDAHLLVDKKAIYPRIIIDKKLVELAITTTKQMAKELSYLGYNEDVINENNVIYYRAVMADLICCDSTKDKDIDSSISEKALDIMKSIFWDCICKDFDGQYFVNYMQYLIHANKGSSWPSEDIYECIRRIILHVIAKMAKHVYNNEILNRYLWLLEYVFKWYENKFPNSAYEHMKEIMAILFESTELDKDDIS